MGGGAQSVMTILKRSPLERRRQVLGAGHPDTLYSLNNLGVMLWQQKRFKEAEPVFAELARHGVASDMDPQVVAKFVAHHGLCLASLDRLADAEVQLRDARSRMNASGLGTSLNIERVLEALVKVCDATGQSSDAAAFRADLSRLRAATQAATTQSTR
jgi:hypothetical protein